MEIWKPIPGYGGHYEASSLGRVRSLDRIVMKRDRHTGAEMRQFYKGKELKQWKGRKKHDHYYVRIGLDKRKMNLAVHRAVLLAFIGLPPDGMEACHNNGISDDNRPENLRWDTHFNNNQDRKKHGNYAVGQDHHLASLDNETVLSIYHSNERGCVLAKRHGCSQTGVSGIRLGNRWASVTGGVPRVGVNTMGPTPKNK